MLTEVGERQIPRERFFSKQPLLRSLLLTHVNPDAIRLGGWSPEHALSHFDTDFPTRTQNLSPAIEFCQPITSFDTWTRIRSPGHSFCYPDIYFLTGHASLSPGHEFYCSDPDFVARTEILMPRHGFVAQAWIVSSIRTF